MGEINTRGAIRTKISSFPSGADSQCLAKSEILSTGVAKVNGNYGDNEYPILSDIITSKTINYVYSYFDRNWLGDYEIYIETTYPVTSTINGTITIFDEDGEFDRDFVINSGKSYVGIGASQVEVYNTTCNGYPREDNYYIYTYG